MHSRSAFRPRAVAGGLVIATMACAATALAATARPVVPVHKAPAVVNVATDGPVRSIRAALAIVARGGTIIVHPGTYRDTTIVIAMPVTIVGDRYPVLDGESKRQIMTVTGDSVTIRGLQFRNVGVAFTEDLAAIKVIRSHDCVIAENRIDNAFFGIYLQEAAGCLLQGNVLRATRSRDATSGNGIHLWHSRDITIIENQISGHRDGIYFEFVREAHVRRNLSENNLRYGLHFMYSDSCDYEGNTFRHNGAGVAVMYTHHVRMTGNDFADNTGAAAYGLLLKEISDSELQGNTFSHNTTGLFADGATRLLAHHNTFIDNGWALKLQSSTDDAIFTENNFAGNTFDVTTNSRSTTTTFTGNYWSEYRGYDLNRDGVGDVAHHPVRLTSVIVAQDEPALILLRSNFLVLMDAAERVFPALTPASLADSAPSMRWVK
jgi:nitrous oxidase accessory protein